jgi:hypothetical protein
MMVGPPAYTQHWMAILEGLFGPAHIDVYLNEVLEFNLKAAISCARAAGALTLEILLERSRRALDWQKDMKQQLKNYMETGNFEGKSEHKEIIDAVRNMRPKERKRFISSIAAQWVTVALSDVLSFTPALLASKARVTEEIASRFLEAFSLSFGATPPDYAIPGPVPAIRVRPIANLGGKYFCSLPSKLIWAIKPRFEDALKQSTRWGSYQTHRANFLVDEGLKAFKRLLPASETHQGLTYPILLPLASKQSLTGSSCSTAMPFYSKLKRANSAMPGAEAKTESRRPSNSLWEIPPSRQRALGTISARTKSLCSPLTAGGNS